MKVTIDEDECSGTGLCTRVCGAVFELNDEFVSHVRVDVIPPEYEDKVQEAADLCPLQAIVITEGKD
jgi:ferredoxin